MGECFGHQTTLYYFNCSNRKGAHGIKAWHPANTMHELLGLDTLAERTERLRSGATTLDTAGTPMTVRRGPATRETAEGAAEMDEETVVRAIIASDNCRIDWRDVFDDVPSRAYKLPEYA